MDSAWIRGCPNLDYANQLRPSFVPIGGLIGRSEAGAYFYEFNQALFSSPKGDVTWADWKRKQYAVAGGLTPILRCNLHGDDRLSHFLNLGVFGRTYVTELNWESVFGRNYARHPLAGDALLDAEALRVLSFVGGASSYLDVDSGRTFCFADSIAEASGLRSIHAQRFHAAPQPAEWALPATEAARTLVPTEATFLVVGKIAAENKGPDTFTVDVRTPAPNVSNLDQPWDLARIGTVDAGSDRQRFAYYAIALVWDRDTPSFPPVRPLENLPRVSLNAHRFDRVLFSEKRVAAAPSALEVCELLILDRPLSQDDVETLERAGTVSALLSELARRDIDLKGLRSFR